MGQIEPEGQSLALYRHKMREARRLLLGTVAHHALRVAGALNGRTNVTNMALSALGETWFYEKTTPQDG